MNDEHIDPAGRDGESEAASLFANAHADRIAEIVACTKRIDEVIAKVRVECVNEYSDGLEVMTLDDWANAVIDAAFHFRDHRDKHKNNTARIVTVIHLAATAMMLASEASAAYGEKPCKT